MAVMKWLNINCECKNGNNIDYGIRHNTAIFWKNSELVQNYSAIFWKNSEHEFSEFRKYSNTMRNE